MSMSRITRRLFTTIHQFKKTATLAPNPFANFSAGKYFATLGGVTLGASFFLRPTVTDNEKIRVIVRVGSLLDLNYQASIGAFIKIAARENKLLTITPGMLREVLRVDEDVKRGNINIETFRTQLKAILGINPSDEDFDTAWNAMLGDTAVLAQRMAAVRAQQPNVIFISFTNAIHARKLDLENQPVFLSYQNNCSGRECYEKLFAQYQLSPEKTALILKQPQPSVPTVDYKNLQDAHTVEAWAERNKIKVCLCDDNKIYAAIRECAGEPKGKPKPEATVGNSPYYRLHRR
jgi:hypothetical protein